MAPCLRGLSVGVCSIFTYPTNFTRKVVNTAEETELCETVELSPPSLHYLLQHLQHVLKKVLSSGGGGFPGRPPANERSKGRGCPVQDLAGKELQGLSPPELLERIKPVLFSFREHMTLLHETIPTELCQAALTCGAAFSDKETDEEQGRFVEPGMTLILQCLSSLLTSSQLKDAASEQTLIDVLGNFGRPQSGAMMSQAPAPAPSTMVEACAVAFDFFDGLVGSQPALTMAAELLSLLRTLVETQQKSSGGEVPSHCDRRERLAALAQASLEREEPDSRDLCRTWKEKAPSAGLVKMLFDSQAS